MLVTSRGRHKHCHLMPLHLMSFCLSISHSHSNTVDLHPFYIMSLSIHRRLAAHTAYVPLCACGNAPIPYATSPMTLISVRAEAHRQGELRTKALEAQRIAAEKFKAFDLDNSGEIDCKCLHRLTALCTTTLSLPIVASTVRRILSWDSYMPISRLPQSACPPQTYTDPSTRRPVDSLLHSSLYLASMLAAHSRHYSQRVLLRGERRSEQLGTTDAGRLNDRTRASSPL